MAEWRVTSGRGKDRMVAVGDSKKLAPLVYAALGLKPDGKRQR